MKERESLRIIQLQNLIHSVYSVWKNLNSGVRICFREYSISYLGGRCILRAWVPGDKERTVLAIALYNKHLQVEKTEQIGNMGERRVEKYKDVS